MLYEGVIIIAEMLVFGMVTLSICGGIVVVLAFFWRVIWGMATSRRRRQARSAREQMEYQQTARHVHRGDIDPRNRNRRQRI
ncbi:hypothetical protein N007_01625 [Alicyclobacillus acidoterrestris ATCC 49025]|nr:hypothetical protein N007_01625 [Alicyclobacillus acidoterrestris ATCC 49025]